MSGVAADFKGCELIVYKVKLTGGYGSEGEQVTVRECGDKTCLVVNHPVSAHLPVAVFPLPCVRTSSITRIV